MRHLFLLAALFCACISYAQIRVQERLPKSKTGFDRSPFEYRGQTILPIS